MNSGISQQRIDETPIAVIDFETTGLTPGYDRVVEASVVRIDPGDKPKLVFDTLINPSRSMAATEIHGITAADVVNAPKFQDITGEFLNALKGCVISAYNVYFDIKFLDYELSNAGVFHNPPHFCLMFLRPLLGLGSKCRLEIACQIHGVDYKAKHIAAHDAIAAGKLYKTYENEIKNQNIITFSDLTKVRNYKFHESYSCKPFPSPVHFGLNRNNKLLSRAGFTNNNETGQSAIYSYWDSLKTILADLEINDSEIDYLKEEQKRCNLKPEQIRMVHARAFSSAITQFISDQWLDDSEMKKLKRLHWCLARLGWAPGL